MRVTPAARAWYDFLLCTKIVPTAAVQNYLNELAGKHGAVSAEPVVRELIGRAVNRLHQLCTSMLHRRYPRLMRPPLNLQTDEMLSLVVERLLKAMRAVRPKTVRQFFALANKHMRWELNDLARRLDEQMHGLELHDSIVPAPMHNSETDIGKNTGRILDAIENLPDEEREVFNLVRIQGMTHSEAADVLEIATKTVQRRLNRGLMRLADALSDLQHPQMLTDFPESTSARAPLP